MLGQFALVAELFPQSAESEGKLRVDSEVLFVSKEIFCISFVVSSMFMSVFSTGILTILHCFVADEEMFEDASRYADPNFQRWIEQQQMKEEER